MQKPCVLFVILALLENRTWFLLEIFIPLLISGDRVSMKIALVNPCFKFQLWLLNLIPAKQTWCASWLNQTYRQETTIMPPRLLPHSYASLRWFHQQRTGERTYWRFSLLVNEKKFSQMNEKRNRTAINLTFLNSTKFTSRKRETRLQKQNKAVLFTNLVSLAGLVAPYFETIR